MYDTRENKYISHYNVLKVQELCLTIILKSEIGTTYRKLIACRRTNRQMENPIFLEWHFLDYLEKQMNHYITLFTTSKPNSISDKSKKYHVLHNEYTRTQVQHYLLPDHFSYYFCL